MKQCGVSIDGNDLETLERVFREAYNSAMPQRDIEINYQQGMEWMETLEMSWYREARIAGIKAILAALIDGRNDGQSS